MIQNLDELEKLLRILRSQGVYTFKWDGLELLMSESVPGLTSPTLADPSMPSQSELDAAVGMPVGGLDDPFLTYNERPIDEDKQV